MKFELTVESAPNWVAEQGLNPAGIPLCAVELAGGVSATVIAVTWPSGTSVVLKQACSRLRVEDVWEADIGRLETEVAALRVYSELTPGIVPRVIAHDAANHIFAMEFLGGDAGNWQSEIAEGRVHAESGVWAGELLGTWHIRTLHSEILEAFDKAEAFRQLRLSPFYEAVMERRSDLASAIAPYRAQLQDERLCLVDGDFAPKNILVLPGGGGFVVDFEVAHAGSPLFDLAFFLSFVVLSAVRWPEHAADLRALGEGFLAGYADATGGGLARDSSSIVGHTACLMLARTDGVSPAQFLDAASRVSARSAGVHLLQHPEDGLWSWAPIPQQARVRV